MIVYVLKLKHDKYFLGTVASKNAEKLTTLESIVDACKDTIDSSAWLRRYPPVRLEEIFTNCEAYDEVKYMLQYMNECGIENVRSSVLSNIEVSEEELGLLRRLVYAPVQKCFVCGASDHFVKHCALARWNRLVRSCIICHSTVHGKNECPLRAPSTTPLNHTYIAQNSTDPLLQRSYASMIFDKLYEWLFRHEDVSSSPDSSTRGRSYEDDSNETEDMDYYIYEKTEEDDEYDRAAMINARDYVPAIDCE